MSDLSPKNQRSTGTNQLVRQWAILRLLELRAYSIRELAETFGSSKSSIQRDLTTLQEHFMIVATSVGQQKRVYRLERNRPPLSVRVSRGELRALDLAIELLQDGSSEDLLALRNKLIGLAGTT